MFMWVSTPQRSARGFSLLELLVVLAITGVLLGLLIPAVQKVREAADRTRCFHNMRQVGVAFHGYYYKHNAFVGWNTKYNYVVPLLPFLENSIASHLDYSLNWDHPKNQLAVRQDISLLICPSVPNSRTGKAASDYCVADHIAGAAQKAMAVPSNPIAGREGFFGSSVNPKPTKAEHVKDGLSHTFLLFEDAGRPEYYSINHDLPNAFPSTAEKWASPLNRITVQVWCGTPINCNNGNEIYSFHTGGTHVLMGDVSGRFLSANVSPKAFVAAFTRAYNDGDLLDQ